MRRVQWMGLCCLIGCASAQNVNVAAIDFDRALFSDHVGHTPRGVLSLRYVRRLGLVLEGAMEPVERASPTLVARENLVLIGTSTGTLSGFDHRGEFLFSLPLRSAIHAPVLWVNGTIYVATDEGKLFAYRNGQNIFRTNIPGPVAQRMLHDQGVIYAATETNQAFAIEASSGQLLWTYARDLPEGFATSAHPGIALTERFAILACSDGTVTAVSRTDGTQVWQFDSSTDVDESAQAFHVLDSDATPVVVGETVYVASQLGGVYALELASGSQRWRREEYTAVTSIVAVHGVEESLLLSSGSLGVLRVTPDGTQVWRHNVARGAASAVTQVGRYGIFSESRGGVVAIDLADGSEVDRYEDGHGFTSEVAYQDGVAAAISNTASLFVFGIEEE